MLDFFKTKAFHDTCENYCPDVVYDYLRGQGWWEHLFHKDFSEQLMGYVQENPTTSALVAATVIGSTLVGSAFAVQKIKAKTASASKNLDDTIKLVTNDQHNIIPEVAAMMDTGTGTGTGTSSPVESEHTLEKNQALVTHPKKLPVATILNKAFDYIKQNSNEKNSSIAAALGISEENVNRFKRLAGFPKSKMLYGQQVIQHPAEALTLLGLPGDGSYPNDDAHYLALAEAMGMSSHTEDKGVRVQVTF